MRITKVFCALCVTLLSLSSVLKSQQPSPEIPVILQRETEFPVRDLDWNFDSTLLAVTDGDVTIIPVDISVEAFHPKQADGKVLRGDDVAWNSTQNHLLIANNVTKLWDYDKNTLVEDFQFPAAVTEDYTPVGNVDWHPEQNRFAIVLYSCEDGTLYWRGARIEIWDVATSTFTPAAGCLWTAANAVKWNTQGTQLAVSGSAIFDEEYEDFVTDEQIEIWDVASDTKVLIISGLRVPSGLAWSPTGDRLAFTTRIDKGRYIQVWDVVADKSVWQAKANFGVIVPLDWHPCVYMGCLCFTGAGAISPVTRMRLIVPHPATAPARPSLKAHSP
jgi:WD40 repeat protein